MTIKEVIEQKGKLLEQLKEAVNAKDFDQEKVDTINKDINDLDKKKLSLEEANRILSEKIEKEVEIEPEKPNFTRDFDDFLRGKTNGNNTEDEGKFRGKPSFTLDERAYQLYKGTDNKGGYLVPDEIGQSIMDAKAYVGGMVTDGVCTWIRTGTGRKIEVPTFDDTATKAAVVAEKTAMTSGSDLTYGTSDLDFYKITSHVLKVSNELLQDAAFNVGAHVQDVLMKRMYRGLNYYFTQGTSGSHPVGINTLSTKGVDATKRTITRTQLSDLVYSVNRAYRTGAKWQMNDTTVGVIRALYVGSTDAGPLWTDSMREGEPNLLEGYPVVVNPDVDDIAPYDRSVFFGDWSRYWIGEALPMKFIRLDELYAESDEVGFVVLGRWAGNLVAYTGDAPIKHARHAST